MPNWFVVRGWGLGARLERAWVRFQVGWFAFIGPAQTWRLHVWNQPPECAFLCTEGMCHIASFIPSPAGLGMRLGLYMCISMYTPLQYMVLHDATDYHSRWKAKSTKCCLFLNSFSEHSWLDSCSSFLFRTIWVFSWTWSQKLSAAQSFIAVHLELASQYPLREFIPNKPWVIFHHRCYGSLSLTLRGLGTRLWQSSMITSFT